jgi:Bromodomain
MQKVLQRMTGGQYNQVDDMVSDFVLMFDNACKYNEPESLIYKVWQLQPILLSLFFLNVLETS